MTENANETIPWISLTKLAARWGKHPSTVARLVREGLISPVTRAGHQMTFSVADVERVEAGMPPNQLALTAILSLLGLENAKLTPAEREFLLNVFYSVPYAHRFDVGFLKTYLDLACRVISAVSRAESMRTIAGSPDLIVKVKNIQRAVNSLFPQEGLHN